MSKTKLAPLLALALPLATPVAAQEAAVPANGRTRLVVAATGAVTRAPDIVRINAGVLMNPIVPGFSSSRAKIERTIKAIADHGARFVGCNVMFLEDGTRAHFMKFLEREFPSWVPRYEKLYVKKYAPQEYRKQIQGMVRLLQDTYGLSKRQAPDDEPVVRAPQEAEQVGFAW